MTMISAGCLPKPIGMTFRAALFAAFAMVPFVSSIDAAELRAVLIGVSQYPSLPERHQLSGPKNDVHALRSILLRRGFRSEDITIIADGVPGAELPVRANIMAALAEQVELAARDDIIFIYFSGHGSRQPAKPDSGEVDGLNEIFLPRDVGRWDEKIGSTEGAIIDQEVKEKVDEMMDKGAFVFAAFDTCHSATMVRSNFSSDDVRWRYVPAADLGVPGTVAGHGLAPLASRTRNFANGAFLYAVQSDEKAQERRMPIGQAEAQPHGAFSFYLMRALENPHPVTYRQIIQFISGQYNQVESLLATPVATGAGLDRTVFGQDVAVPRVWSFNMDKRSINAGALQGLADGALFALIPDALAVHGDALGYFRAKRVDAHRSELQPIAHQGLAAPSTDNITPDSHLRLDYSPPPQDFSVLIDRSRCGRPCSWDDLNLDSEPLNLNFGRIKWAKSNPDFTLKYLRDSVLVESMRFAGCSDPQCAVKKHLLINSDPSENLDRNALIESLEDIVRARMLSRTAASNLMPLPRGLSLDVIFVPRVGKNAALAPVQTAANGDQIHILAKNNGFAPQDITILLVNSDYEVDLIYPIKGSSNRIGSGEQLPLLRVGLGRADYHPQLRDAEPLAEQSQLIIALAQAEAKSQPSSLSHFAQDGIEVRSALSNLVIRSYSILRAP